MSYPSVVFIVPYRDRSQHKFFFTTYMNAIYTSTLDADKFEVYFAHQADNRPFNRGAAKNIGFLAIKAKYPDDYKKITFVFNDIDTVPFNNILKYTTVSRTVKHFYGFEYALGGIVAFTGEDFEAVDGYPNYWGWGLEDSGIQAKCISNNLIIDRTQFYPIGDPNILHLFDGVSRILSNDNNPQMRKAIPPIALNGLASLHNISYVIEIDRTSCLNNEHMFMINISNFNTCVDPNNTQYTKYDLRTPITSKTYNSTTAQLTSVEAGQSPNWSNIPPIPPSRQQSNYVSIPRPRQVPAQQSKQNYQNQNLKNQHKTPPSLYAPISSKYNNYKSHYNPTKFKYLKF